MDYLEKKIKKISEKYKNKKILLYGAGEYATEILNLYDFSSLNIVCLTDKKFKQDGEFLGYKTCSVNDAEKLDFDVIIPLIKRPYLINLKKGKKVWLKKGDLILKNGFKLHFCNIFEESFLRFISYINKNKNTLNYIVARLDELKAQLDECKNELKTELEVMKKVNQIEMSVFKTHQQTFPKYKNINKGKDIYLIATGPSLADFEPTDKNAVYIGVNKAFYSDKFKLDYLFIQDVNVGQTAINDAIEYSKKNNTKLFLGRNDDNYIPEPDDIQIERYYTDWYLGGYNSKFAFDIEVNPLGDFHSVSFAAMQFALYTNPDKIFLVGCDSSLNGYFYDKKYENFLYDDVVANWHLLREWSQKYYPDTKIVSINPVKLQSLFDEDIYTTQNFNKFLIENKLERMDANRDDIFEKTRCDFHMDRYNFACQYTENKVCIDCASGTGYGVDIIKKQGNAKEVFGVEINNDAVEYSKKIYASENVYFYNGSIFELPFEDNKFDVFTCFETIEHVENEDKLLSEVKRVLKNDGIFIVSTPNDWKSDVMNPHHVRQYDYYKLKQTLEKYFNTIEIYNQNSGTPNRIENNDQPRQIIKTSDTNQELAECFIAVCAHKK